MDHVETPQSHCCVGVARGDITPPVGIYHRMWGAAVHDRSTGVHRPLTATVLFLKSLEEQAPLPLVVIAVDHCLLWSKEMNALLDSISQISGVHRDSLIVFFSHTHSAGLMGLERQDLPGGELIAPYLEDLARTIAGLVLDAQQRQKKATIVYGYGSCGLATHRDFLDRQRGHYVCGFNPTGKADSTVVVGRISNEVGAPIATLVNYACHPTTLAWDNTLIGPDYVGAMRDVIELATDVPCFFIQGASGDIGPKEGFVSDVNVADRNGRQLGYAALAALESLPPAGHRYEYLGPVVSGATIGTWGHRIESAEQVGQYAAWLARCELVSMRYRSDLPSPQELDADDAGFRAAERAANDRGDVEGARNARAMIERTTRRIIRIAPLPTGDFYPYPIRVWRIGHAVWVALDGEHYNVLQRSLRERFPGIALVIGTLANGSNVWYLPDSASYGLGLYEEDVSVLAQGSLERVLEASVAAIQELFRSNS